MVAIVAAETVLLLVLILLVAGLLRSHAEILRRLGPAGEGPPAVPAPDALAPAAARNGAGSAPPIAGTTPRGDAVTLAFDGPGAMPTLLAFLTSGCSTCAGFWEALGEPRLPAGIQTLIVTKGSERERPARLRSLAPAGVPVVMSSAAWKDYAVPGAPYFVLLDGAVLGEGLATTWQAVASLVSDAVADQREAEARAGSPSRGGSAARDRARTIDEKLTAAGVSPGHPSLYPGTSDRVDE